MDYLSNKKVISFSIAPVNSNSDWQENYHVSFKKLTMPLSSDAAKWLTFNKPLNNFANSEVMMAARCDGNIDVIQGITIPPHFSATALLNVNGWLAISAEEGQLAESVFLVLTDKNGKNTFIETTQTIRTDVGAHFKKSQLDAAGYKSRVDVSQIVGDYTLGLAFKEDNQIKICPQFNIAGTFNGLTSHEK